MIQWLYKTRIKIIVPYEMAAKVSKQIFACPVTKGATARLSGDYRIDFRMPHSSPRGYPEYIIYQGMVTAIDQIIGDSLMVEN